jgi:alpha-tubulin suppressor-like RCC1 family protein
MRKTDGSLWCWGNNSHGQLGTGDTRAEPTPIRIDRGELEGSVAGVYLPQGSGDISSRTAFSCARRNDGTLWCWGSNEYGQLGTGNTQGSLQPVQVVDLGTEVHAVSLGGGFACARKNDNSLWCWGANEFGQLGLGDTENRTRPEQVDAANLGTDVRYASTGAIHTCARKTDGTLWCWGNNQNGQLGTGDTMPRTVPTRIESPDLSADVDAPAAGSMFSCATKTDLTLWCWGANQYGQLGVGDDSMRLSPAIVELPDLAGGVPLISAGGAHTCAAKSDGTLWCWGNNRSGQLGAGNKDNSSVPVQVKSEQFGAQIGVVYAGGLHTCARNLDNSLWCWGSNQYGQLGIGSGPGRDTPVLVESSCP